MAITETAPTRAPLPGREHCEVLIVGSGPSGASAAYWLAEAGVDVILLERKHFPREKTCGDGLTPRSVRQLYDMGLEGDLASHHRYDGLRAQAFGRELTLPWPEHPDYPSHGYVVTRHDLDALVAARAQKAGARLYEGAEALEPLASGTGRAGGARVADKDHGGTAEIEATYTLVADGANSRFGRALGATRDRDLPQGMAIRGYFSSPRHAEAYIESHLDIRDKAGAVVPGYGWIFPLGDGRVNVGIGVLSTFARWREVNTTQLMSAFVDYAPDSWCLSDETSLGAPTGGRLPMGLAVGPRVGADYLLAGDAGGSINPFNGEGIAYGYETGRLAAEVLAAALAGAGAGSLVTYEATLTERYGLYYKVASAFVRLIGRPELMRVAIGTGMYSRTLMEWVLRIMANLLRPDELGPAELAYKAVARLVQIRD
jgi:menaquinone-9 beta-reductase